MQDVTIPALGMAMTGAVLTRWYKEPGETVAAGEAIAEIETDKSAVDLEPGRWRAGTAPGRRGR